MNAASWIVLGAVAAAFVLGVLWGVRRRKAGKGCCGDCTRCGKSCAEHHINGKN